MIPGRARGETFLPPVLGKEGRKLYIAFFVLMGSFLVLYIILPLVMMFMRTSLSLLIQAVSDPQVLSSIALSLYASAISTGIIVVLGIPLAYLLARLDFRGKRLVESIIDLPIVIPHSVAGIAILSMISERNPIGRGIHLAGLDPVGHLSGIVMAMMFVSLPFFVDSARDGFKSVPVRLEKVSRTLGAPFLSTFFRVSLPLSKRSILSGIIMSWARGISEFGAVLIITYHPMVAPVLIYERFEAYGLEYSTPISTLLIMVIFVFFVLLRFVSSHRGESN